MDNSTLGELVFLCCMSCFLMETRQRIVVPLQSMKCGIGFITFDITYLIRICKYYNGITKRTYFSWFKKRNINMLEALQKFRDSYLSTKYYRQQYLHNQRVRTYLNKPLELFQANINLRLKAIHG